MARGNPQIYKSARQFQASDDWGEPLSKKPAMVRLPQSAFEYLETKADRGAWLRRVIMAAIEAELTPVPEPEPVPSSPPALKRYSREELESMTTNNLVILMRRLRNEFGADINLRRGQKSILVDRILAAQN